MNEEQEGMATLATVNQTGDLVAEFRSCVALVHPQIEAKLSAIDDLFEECKALSERFGVPFQTKMYDEEQQWTPKSALRWSGDSHPGIPLGEMEAAMEDLFLNPYADAGFEAAESWRSSSIGC